MGRRETVPANGIFGKCLALALYPKAFTIATRGRSLTYFRTKEIRWHTDLEHRSGRVLDHGEAMFHEREGPRHLHPSATTCFVLGFRDLSLAFGNGLAKSAGFSGEFLGRNGPRNQRRRPLQLENAGLVGLEYDELTA